MTQADNIEKKLENLNFKSTAAMREKILSEASQAMEQTINAAANRPNVGRIIMKSNITKFAAAAVIIIALTVGLYFPGGRVDLAAPAFGQIIKNMQQVDWIYVLKENLKEGYIREQIWASRNQEILIGREFSGSTGLFDFRSKRQYLYYPHQNTVEISRVETDFPLMYEQMLSSHLYMDKILEQYSKEDAYVITQKGTYNGRKALIYKFEIALSDGVAEISTWVVDTDTYLPIINEIRRVTSEGKLHQSYRYAFDYPKTGPTDIYDLGVPRDAKVIDKTPENDLVQFLDTYHENAEQAVPRYTAIVKVHGRPEMLEYRDGPRCRFQRYDLAIKGYEWQNNRDMYLEQIGNTFDSTYNWLMKTDVIRCMDIYLHNDESFFKIGRMEIEEGKSPSRQRHPSTPSDNLKGLGWPRIRYEGVLTEDDYSSKNGLICIQQASSKRYVDPNRGYLCVMHEYTIKDRQVQRIVEPAQTKSGRWYPKSVRISGSKPSTTVLIDDAPDFPENIFSPESLPNYDKLKDQAEQTIVLRKPSYDPNEFFDYEGFTPLHMAAFLGKSDIARHLLAEGADVNPKHNAGTTPIELAAAAGRLDMVKLLFKHDADLMDKSGRCALASAVDGGNLEVLKFMLENGANVNGLYKNGQTALHHAAKQARPEFVKLLLEYGADVTIKDNTYGKFTPLFAAVENSVYHNLKPQYTKSRDVETVRLLLKAGADVDTIGQSNMTPLLFLCYDLQYRKPNIELIKLLIEHSTDVNYKRESGPSMLINAVRAKNLDVAKILLEAGVDPFIEDCTCGGSVAADIAGERGYKEIEILIREYMEPKASNDNKAVISVITKFLDAVREDSDKALKLIDLDCPYYGRWESKIKNLHDDYSGQFELFDEILSAKAQNGWAEVIIKRPKSDKKKYLSIILMQYPDDSWKVISYYSHSRSFSPYSVPASSERNDLDDYQADIFKAWKKQNRAN